MFLPDPRSLAASLRGRGNGACRASHPRRQPCEPGAQRRTLDAAEEARSVPAHGLARPCLPLKKGGGAGCPDSDSAYALASATSIVPRQSVLGSYMRLQGLYTWLAYVTLFLAIVLGATMFTPLRSLVQSLIDRVFYRRSYQYRKTLLTISQELSRERNLEVLARRLLELIANALSLRTIALLLPIETGVRKRRPRTGRFTLADL